MQERRQVEIGRKAHESREAIVRKNKGVSKKRDVRRKVI